MSKPTDHHLDPDSPATDDERAEAEALRLALEEAPSTSRAGEFANALRVAANPGALPEAVNRELIARAVKSAPPARGRLVRATFGGAFAVWAAAAAWVFYARFQSARFGSEEAPFLARSTAPLFSEPFRAGEKSARIDRIAIARADNFRENRFGQWGVR